MDGTVAPSQIIINGQEYAPEDAQSLIELGNKYREYETNLNTSLDKVVPEYTKATQKASYMEEENKKLKEEQAALADYKRRWEEYEASKQQAEKDAQTPPDTKKALEAARQIGLLDQQAFEEKLSKSGFMTKAQMDDYWKTKRAEEESVNQILSKASELEKKIDGKDGRVPFMKEAVLPYANAYGIQDLEEAYNKMNERLNAGWKAQQLEAAKTKGLQTMKGGGKKEPPKPGKTTDDNVKDRLREALWGAEE
jgi:hypothetical protein